MRRKAVAQKRWLIPSLLLLACCCAASAQNLIFVANKDVHISEIKISDLRAIFTGEKTRFADGTRAVPVILKGGPAQEVFVQNYCGETGEEFRAQWREAIFTGQGSMPRAFDSESAVLEYVAKTPGAIGYVSRVSQPADVKPLTPLK